MSEVDLNNRLQSAKEDLAGKNVGGALTALTQLRHDYPLSADVLVVLAAAQAQNGDLGDAVESLSAAAIMKPNARTYYNLAVVQKQKGSLDQSTLALEKALELDPAYERAKQMLQQMEQLEPQLTTHAQPTSQAQPRQSAQHQAPAQTIQMPPPHFASQGHPQAAPYQQQPPYAQYAGPGHADSRLWWKIIVGGILIGLGGLMVWGIWVQNSFFLTGGQCGIAGALFLGIAATIGIGYWLSRKAGAFESWDWVIMIVLTGLIPSLLMVKGFDLVASGWYNT